MNQAQNELPHLLIVTRAAVRGSPVMKPCSRAPSRRRWSTEPLQLSHRQVISNSNNIEIWQYPCKWCRKLHHPLNCLTWRDIFQCVISYLNTDGFNSICFAYNAAFGRKHKVFSITRVWRCTQWRDGTQIKSTNCFSYTKDSRQFSGDYHLFRKIIITYSSSVEVHPGWDHIKLLCYSSKHLGDVIQFQQDQTPV